MESPVNRPGFSVKSLHHLSVSIRARFRATPQKLSILPHHVNPKNNNTAMKTNTKTTTLQDRIIATKCRKGKAHAITDRGAYWLACPPIVTRRYGGDGIGQDSADCTNTLELRHYRDGTVRCLIVNSSWHQNHGHHRSANHVEISFQTTAEEVIVMLKNHSIDDRQPCSDYFQPELIATLVALGLPEYEVPSPDDEATPTGA